MNRKSEPESGAHYVFGPFELDVAERRLRRDGADVALTRKTFDLLLALIEDAGHLRSRDALIATLWPDTIVEEHSLTWNLSALRKALGDTGDAPQYIETVRGHGYRFIAPLHAASPAAPELAVPAASAEPGPSIAAVSDQASAAPDSPPSSRIGFAAAGLLALALAVASIVAWHDAVRPPTKPPTTTAAVPPQRSVAVLPFENLSADPGNAYFASGIQETILTKLAGIAALRVVSRASTEHYQSHPDNLPAIVAQLGVATVLEGSVQREGDKVLINVQLIDGRNGDHLWAQSYTRTLDQAFEVQRDVAEQVAAALEAQLLPGEATRVASLPTRDAIAYDLFLQAEYAALQIESGNATSPAASTAAAREFYAKAIARDPKFALAYARLSYLESHAYWLDIDHTPERAAAGRVAAERALALEPDLALAHVAMGYAHYYGRRDYAAALAEFERARRDLPNNADVNASIANVDRRLGRWEAALDGYERASVLDPRNPQFPALLGDSLTMLRRYDEAEAAYDRARAVNPNSYAASLSQGLCILLRGDVERARRALDAIPAGVDPEGLASALRFAAAWAASDFDAALAILDGAPALIEAPWTPGYIPSSLLRAQALQARGDAAGAQREYRIARDLLQSMLAAQPDNPAVVSLLGLAQAGLNERDAAIRSGQRAVELLPVGEDAVDGPYYPATLAEIHLRIGDNDAAAAILRELLALPAGRVVSMPLVEHDPRYRAVAASLRQAR